jgi:putative lipoprotein
VNVKPIRIALFLCSALVVSSALGADPSATITGTANYVASFTIGNGAVFEATLEDVSIADAPAQRIGSAMVQSPGGAPLQFSIAYDPQLIDPTHRYAVRARIKDHDRVLFATQTSYPVLGDGQVTHVDIELREVASASDPVGSVADAADAPLENTFWKLNRVGNSSVTIAAGTREIHLTLKSDALRVSGFSGCNTFTGTYSLEGGRLTFGNLASTMMACPSGMDIEQAFQQALGETVTWRIGGQTLELVDPSGTVVAVFEARLLN